MQSDPDGFDVLCRRLVGDEIATGNLAGSVEPPIYACLKDTVGSHLIEALLQAADPSLFHRLGCARGCPSFKYFPSQHHKHHTHSPFPYHPPAASTWACFGVAWRSTRFIFAPTTLCSVCWRMFPRSMFCAAQTYQTPSRVRYRLLIVYSMPHALCREEALAIADELTPLIEGILAENHSMWEEICCSFHAPSHRHGLPALPRGCVQCWLW